MGQLILHEDPRSGNCYKIVLTAGLLGLPLEEACRMAAQYPAEFLGIAGERGRIAPGYRADLVLLDGELRVQSSWIGGRE